MGLQCSRHAGEELIDFYYSLPTPKRAIHYPLPAQAVSAVGRPTRVRERMQVDTTAALHSPDASQEPPDGAHLSAAFPLRPLASGKAQQQVGTSVPLPDLLHLADLLAPASVEVTRDRMRLEYEY